MSRPQRIELFLFIACFFAFSYFHQGGGWNQNARFAEVRAIVEEGRFAIDDFLVYETVAGSDVLRRNPVDHGEYTRNGTRFRLAWVDTDYKLFPINEDPTASGLVNSPMIEVCASGDIAYVPWTGHFHPNKPPGTSFVAVPAYWVLFHMERVLGLNPDHWWILTLNAWLTTLCSVGLFAAGSCVLFFRLARDLSAGDDTAAVLATLTFGFGTTFFPFATILFDHALTASLLLAAFYFLRCGKTPSAQTLAGVCAGMAAVTNYVAAVAGFFLGVYALLASGAGGRNWRAARCFSFGVIGPFVLICAYGWICFGSPFKINNDFQNPLFKDPGGALLGMFAIPKSVEAWARLSYVAGLLSVSPFRGLFYFAPVLVLGLYGFWIWLKERSHVAEALLCLSIAGFFFVVNITFNGYHGGFSAGPRYLVPGIPFLALPLVVAFRRRPRLAVGLAVVSAANQLVLTATDAQNPAGVGGHTRLDDLPPEQQRRQEWDYNLLGDYAWPLFLQGRAWPLLDDQVEAEMDKEMARIEAQTADPGQRIFLASAYRAKLLQAINQGDGSPFLLGSVAGPVSVNPIGVFEGLFTYGFYPPMSLQCRFASFNAGEFVWPNSRWSLAPLLLISGGFAGAALGLARAPKIGRVEKAALAG